MRVFISADIEGVTTTANWDNTEIGKPGYELSAQQMTAEVKAACDGAIAAGADYILVKDAHDSATNIDISKLPECVEVIRGWSGQPYGMATGVDKSFDAAMFVGYHSAAGRDGNPLSHTYSTDTTCVKLNGVKCSEFRLYSYACALEGVPTVLLTGDQMLCRDSSDIHPMLQTVAVKDGFGGMTRAINPGLACKRIKDAAEAALRQDLSAAHCEMPTHFDFEITYKEHRTATRKSFFPGFKKIDDNTIAMSTDNFLDVLRACEFVL